MIILVNLSLPATTIKVIRDDLYPFVGGGNKARKALYYERYMIEHGLNAIVTTGFSSSLKRASGTSFRMAAAS